MTTKLLPTNISMFSMVLGVLVGLAVLILLVLLLIAFAFRTCRQRAAYAQRKALSDQANTETTFSDGEKAQQQHHHDPSSPSLGQRTSSANSYGYRQNSDSGAGIGGMASTYLSHPMFASDSCWPSGLQPVPPGGNYFGEDGSGVAFPPLGRDSGSHGYVQLPVSENNWSYKMKVICILTNGSLTCLLLEVKEKTSCVRCKAFLLHDLSRKGSTGDSIKQLFRRRQVNSLEVT